ncbi:uncharacterized protein LOC131669113 isoform X1 [Phymastichus coffea]|uniref:uncharacterized protein LOC131669113 isoform X1 n=1 Tax=Phymastichus coffea TaxID=108790 RepID=UPI00273C8DC4|nr:uncharacterized protein LOC131669113 isoform X1 [Phymastichus coffea]
MKMSSTKAALIKLKSGRFFAIAAKFVKIKRPGWGSFKLKNAKRPTDCEIIGFNENKSIFSSIAENLNANLPQVEIELNASLKSTMLSTSIISLNKENIIHKELNDSQNKNLQLSDKRYVEEDENSSILSSKNDDIFRKLNITHSSNRTINSSSPTSCKSQIDQGILLPHMEATSIECEDVFKHFEVFTDFNAEEISYSENMLDWRPGENGKSQNDIMDRSEDLNFDTNEILNFNNQHSVELITGEIDLAKKNTTQIEEDLINQKRDCNQNLTNKTENEQKSTSTGKSKTKSKQIVILSSEDIIHIKKTVSDLNKPGTPQAQNKIFFVNRPTIDKKRTGKFHYCIFCKKKIVDQIHRHMTKVHAGEEVFKEAKARGKTVFKCTVEYHINYGNYYYNYYMKTDDEEMIVGRRPNKYRIIKCKQLESGELKWPEDITDCKMGMDEKTKLPVAYKTNLPNLTGENFVPCKDCFKVIRRNLMKRHKCNLQNVVRAPNAKDLLPMCQRLIPDVHPLATKRARDLIFSNMILGEVRDVAVSDALIVQYVNDCVDHYSHDQNYSMISHHARVLATLFQTVQSNTNPVHKEIVKNITEFKDIIHPTVVPVLQESIYQLSEMNEESGMIQKFNKPKDISNIINKFLEFYLPFCIENAWETRRENAIKFEKLIKSKSKRLNKKSRDMQLKIEKKAPPKKMPNVKNIKEFCEFVEQSWLNAFNNMKNGFDITVWKELNNTTALLLMLFNRKRQGELSRLELDDINGAFKILDDCNDPRYLELSDDCKVALKDYYRLKITNKKALRTVGLIVHKNLMDSINLLLQYRTKAGIDEKNIYVFAKRRNNTMRHGYIILSDVLRHYANISGVEDCETIRGTALRKHIATMMHGLRLEEGKLMQLANFLGHSYDIHKSIYRQEVHLSELLTLPIMLNKAQGKELKSIENVRSPSTSNNKTDNSDVSYDPCQDTEGMDIKFIYIFMCVYLH